MSTTTKDMSGNVLKKKRDSQQMDNIVLKTMRLMVIAFISNVNISNKPIFLLKKREKLLHCKSSSHFFQ